MRWRASSGPNARLDQPFALKLGQAATLPDTHDTRITFTTLLEDSRCPMNVNCMTAGQQTPLDDYQVTMRVTKGSLNTTRANFNEPFTLKLGQSVDISDGSRLIFEAVSGDSRCPAR